MHLLGPGKLLGDDRDEQGDHGRRLANERAQNRSTNAASPRNAPMCPVRMLARSKPTVHGTQTAIVVGQSGEPVHTDRDGRIKA